MSLYEASSLDAQSIIEAVRIEVREYQDLYTVLPELELRNIWINGSFGADAADENSDIDITIEVGVVGEHDMKDIVLADKITGLSGQVQTVLNSILPAYTDVTVIPSESIIRGAELNAETAWEHVRSTQNHGGYDTVYDVYEREYITV